MKKMLTGRGSYGSMGSESETNMTHYTPKLEDTYTDGSTLLDRTRMRLKQDMLLHCADCLALPRHLMLADGCPVSLAELVGCVWLEWEPTVDRKLSELSTECRVPLPTSWNDLARRAAAMAGAQ